MGIKEVTNILLKRGVKSLEADGRVLKFTENSGVMKTFIFDGSKVIDWCSIDNKKQLFKHFETKNTGENQICRQLATFSYKDNTMLSIKNKTLTQIDDNTTRITLVEKIPKLKTLLDKIFHKG